MYVNDYAILDGLVHVSILVNKDGQHVYWVEEPKLSKEEENILMRVRDELGKLMSARNAPSIYDYGNVREYVKGIAESLIRRHAPNISPEGARRIMYYVLKNTVGFGPIEPLVNDPRVEDVHINGPGRGVYVWHNKYGHIKTNISITDDELSRLVTLLSQRIRRNPSSASPILEGLLMPENFRVEMLLRDVASIGPILTIRKFREIPLTVVEMIKLGTLSSKLAAYLWFMLDHSVSILIIGPTGAGKTTLLNALLFLVRNGFRIITIEDARELYLLHDHWVPLVARTSEMPGVANVDLYELVKVSMRLRPDYIVVGELRGEESYVFFQALASGHTGLSTLHAYSAEMAIRRLLSKPMEIPATLLTSLGVIVQISVVAKGDEITRRVTRVEEVIDVQEDRPILNRVFEWRRSDDSIVNVNDSVLINRIIENHALQPNEVKAELSRREKLIELMVKSNVLSPSSVFEIINKYYVNPDEAFNELNERNAGEGK
ncbi:type II/IV secretion system ATPase subunit [Caldivirga sp. UBA161]|uniref:type II/IV secretion system ATPase subunit n=1 Tax=Caldivirga sp. UBA161 TaxID=1915569 RepID=UPI0025B9E925|nr:type II/IV secretion system ATPase subunit [Caldivirga sp. UBA161]